MQEYEQRYMSKVLWHFTGYNKSDDETFKILKLIIQTNQLKLSQEDEPVIMPSDEKREGHKCICTCDIPFKDLKNHIGRYGKCGIAFKKENAIKKGHFNPLLYVQYDNHIFEHIEKLVREIEYEISENELLESKFQEFLNLLGSYTKPSDFHTLLSFDPKVDQQQLNNFYYEREWRSLYEWNFTVDDISSIMIPQKYLKEFNEQFPELTNKISIFTTEMVEIL